MKLPLKLIVKRLTTEASSVAQQFKQDLRPLKTPIKVVKEVVGAVISFITLWTTVPTVVSISFAILIISGILFLCRGELVKLFKGEDTDWVTEGNRLILLILSAASSIGIFLWAILEGGSFTLYFSAGVLGLLALQTAKARCKAQKIQRGIFPFLVGNLTEPLLIFTVVAGIYSIPALLLHHGVESGSITLRQLNRFNAFTILGRKLLGRLHYSALAAVAFAGLAIFPGWVERRWIQRRPPHPKLSWHIVRHGLKWSLRIAIVALFAAMFLSLSVRQYRADVALGLHEFKDQYSQLQNLVETPLERVVQRELMARIWTQLKDGEKEEIRGSVRNRKAFKKFELEYTTLAAVANANGQTESFISRMQAPVFSEERPIRPRAPAEEHVLLPDDLGDASLNNLRAAHSLNADPESGAVPESAEEVNEMASAVKISIIGLAAENATDKVRLYTWLDMHFSGLSEILDCIRDARGESLNQVMKDARERVIKRKAATPMTRLAALVAEEGRAAAARVSLRPIQLSNHSSSISAETDRIQRAENSLRRQAPKEIKTALEMSKSRTDHMFNQLTILDRRFPFLNLSAAGFIQQHPNFGYALEYWAIAAFQTTEKQEAQLRMLDNLKTLVDADSVAALSRQLQTEQYYENLLAELVGQEESELQGIRDILGPDYDKYVKDYEARFRGRIGAAGGD
jgi:hypothetical protein